MPRTDYILRSLSKTTPKRWEHYVVNRIFHLLNDPEIEFVCQQCVRGRGGNIYLADMFFPQLNCYLEVDEGHHEIDEVKKRDALRGLDIADAAGLEEYRIPTNGISLDDINNSVDRFVSVIRARKDESVRKGDFLRWDYEDMYTARPHIEAGSMTIGPRAAFRTHRDALNCFGYAKGHYQRAVWNLPDNCRDAIGLSGKCMVWFPKLNRRAEWDNSLSDDGTIITEINTTGHQYTESYDSRIVMAQSRDSLNRTLYRFIGVFEIVPDGRSGSTHRFRRVSTTVKTCHPQA